MDARRRALGMSWEELALKAQVGRETLRRIREGGGGPKAVRNVEASLGWRIGSVADIDDGGEPRVIDTDDVLRRPVSSGGPESVIDRLREIWLQVGTITFWAAVQTLQAEAEQTAESHRDTGS